MELFTATAPPAETKKPRAAAPAERYPYGRPPRAIFRAEMFGEMRDL